MRFPNKHAFGPLSTNRKYASVWQRSKAVLSRIRRASKRILRREDMRSVRVYSTLPGGKIVGLYSDEVCLDGTCSRPPGHSGECDQFDGPQSLDSVPMHPIDPSDLP